MDLRHIEAFRAVMGTGSMTAAAQAMHTSQPQISRLIAELEQITKFTLFHRNGSRIAPTLESARFFKEVEKTFVGLSALETAAARIRVFNAGRLTVAAMPRLAGGVLARAVARFKRNFPDVLVSIQSGDAASIDSWVSTGLCDMGLAMVYAETSALRITPVMSMRCVALLPAGHPLCALDELTPRDLDGQPFISFASGTALCTRLDSIFDEEGVRPIITAEASLGASVCALVAEGVGLSLINPLAAAEEIGWSALETRPFRPAIELKLVFLYPEYGRQNRLTEEFSRVAIDVIHEELKEF